MYVCDFPPQENSIRNLPAAPAPTTKTLFLFASFPSFALLIFLFEIGSIGSVSLAVRCVIDGSTCDEKQIAQDIGTR